MKKNFRVIRMLIKCKLSRMLMFRADFFTAFWADGVLFLVQLLIFETIYSQVDTIGNWSRGEMIIFIGTFSIINALNMLIYFFGIVDIPGKIKRGDLDQYLIKPMNPLLRLTFENVNPGSFPLVIMSILIVCYGVSVSGVHVTFGVWVGYTVLVLLMTVLWYDMEVILRSITFLVMSSGGIQRLAEQFLELNFKVPGVLYKGALKVLFYYLLPYGIMSTIPTQFLSGSITMGGIAVAVCTVCFFTAFMMWFWQFGLKHYKSASS